MLRTDRFLLGIVVGAVALVVVAFAVVLTRPKPAYQPDDTPAGVAFNYLLALQREDYPRAYGYLWPGLKGYPASADDFALDVRQRRGSFRSDAATIQIERTEVRGDQAFVEVRETSFQADGLFSSGQSTWVFSMTLRRTADGWKIAASGSYWSWCWDQAGGC
ncbi:MAG TPA: hypothetical protein VNL77_11845 [Roseiflexaceae bacterium]|nr:hypothetical protein [Roseiflexaceae bacterium]